MSQERIDEVIMVQETDFFTHVLCISGAFFVWAEVDHVLIYIK